MLPTPQPSGAPSLSDGLWLVLEADADALVRPLLATLARLATQHDGDVWIVTSAERTLRRVEGRDGALEESRQELAG